MEKSRAAASDKTEVLEPVLLSGQLAFAEKGLREQGGEERKMTVQNGIYSLSPSFCCSEPKHFSLCQPGDQAL